MTIAAIAAIPSLVRIRSLKPGCAGNGQFGYKRVELPKGCWLARFTPGQILVETAPGGAFGTAPPLGRRQGHWTFAVVNESNISTAGSYPLSDTFELESRSPCRLPVPC